jgi:mono/diheme cytochrome c family protein
VSARSRRIVLAVVAAAVLYPVAATLPLRSWLGLAPPLEVTPALAAAGERFVASRCLGCHRDIALPPRVRGWDVNRAYDTLGRLPEVNRGMPPFPGDESDRRAVAAYLVVLGGAAAEVTVAR